MSSQRGEESLSLLEEKTLSDLENESIRNETDRLFPSPHLTSFSATWLKHSISRWLRPSSIYPFLFTLLPSFVQSRMRGERIRQDRLYPTAYLDGMRGLAALFVFFCHYSYTCFIITMGFGRAENRNLLQLPIIRLFYSGPPMVCVFFVISGYALTLKPLRQMRAQSWEALLHTMTSSVFRRGLRLFIPTTISTFLVFMMLRMGMYEPSRSLSGDKALHRNIQEHHPDRMEHGFFAQFYDWVWQMFNFVCVFNWAPFAGSTGYDVHLWTIPVEFRASLMLFLAVVGFARLRCWLRLSALVGLITFVLRNDRWELLLFYSGMFIAELDLIVQSSPSDSNLSILSSRMNAKTKSAIWISVALVSLYFMSQPDEYFWETPGWVWLSSMIPDWFSEKYRYWQSIGSAMFVLAVTRLPLLQAPFNTTLVQYFGKISYALYLMHGPVMHTIGYLIEGAAWSITGTESEGAYITGFLIGAAINIPLVIWAADVFWRAVDAPSVKFARWLEQRLIVEGATSGGQKGKELPR